MAKLKGAFGAIVGAAGVYLLANTLFPEETQRYKEKAAQLSREAMDQAHQYKDLAVEKGQNMTEVAKLASEETKGSFSGASEDIKSSLNDAKEQVLSLIEKTQNHLNEDHGEQDKKEIIAEAIAELKEEVGKSFGDITSNFSSLKSDLEDTTEATIQLTKEEVSNELDQQDEFATDY